MNKLCPKCKQQLPLNEFYKYRGKSQSWCKKCTNECSALRVKNDIVARYKSSVLNAKHRDSKWAVNVITVTTILKKQA